FGCAFLLITLVSGRVWCGWACPQTTLSDSAEWVARTLSLTVRANRLIGSRWRILVAQLAYLLLALLVSTNLIWYFIEPRRFFASLWHGELPSAVLLTLLITALLIYLDIALVRRLLCREFCPYGRIQSSLVDAGTLTLQLPATEKPRCIRCHACVRACPLEIDIRQGYQIECINCGRCLDACRRIMARRGEAGLIRYRFGTDAAGIGALFNPRVVVLGLLLVFLAGALFFATWNRSAATLKVAVSPAAVSRVLADGGQLTLFNAWINNRTTTPQEYRLSAVLATGEPLEVRGQTENILLADGANRELSLIVISPVQQQHYMIEFRLVNPQQQVVTTARARITPVPQN
ncbi:MAG: 4Fe-4S dicluster domain-containing protein, partial [Pelovirga sp.]